jgi:hypothetical protein
MRKKQLQCDIQRHIRSAIMKSTGKESDATLTHSISQNFLVFHLLVTFSSSWQEWVVKSGKSQQLLDLIHLDMEDNLNGSGDGAMNQSDGGPKTLSSLSAISLSPSLKPSW